MFGAAESFGGTTPAEWAFVIVVSGHISLMPWALWGMRHREKKKMQAFAKNRGQAVLYLDQHTRGHTSSRRMRNLTAKTHFLQNDSNIQIHAGVAISDTGSHRGSVAS